MGELNAEFRESLFSAIKGNGAPLKISKEELEESKKNLDLLLEGSDFEAELYKGQVEAAKEIHANLTF
jgi:hypothetical protein